VAGTAWSSEAYGSESYPTGGALDFCLGLLTRLSRRDDARAGLVRGSPEDAEPVLERASEGIAKRVGGLRALALVGLDGQVDEQFLPDPTVRPEHVSEFATLVRIAERTSHDANSLDLFETTWSSRGGTVLSCRVDAGRFLLLFGAPGLRTSLARYVLRQTARRMSA
jgi:predicted regulator of Ras-like GTPase activity (Roadblock/LC7/MglB family)